MQQAPPSGFAAAPDRAATFADRGVAIPFTAPALLATRARAAGQGSLEFLLPNPAGARGFYVAPWEALSALSKPSLHDMLLWRALRVAGPPTPRLVRGVSLRLLSGGAAGPLAQAAATAALAADAAALEAVRSALLMRLTLGTEPPGTQPSLAADTPSGRERRAARALWALGAAQGEEAGVVARNLNHLAALAAPLAEGGAVARDLAALDRLAGRLRAMSGDPLAAALAGRVGEAMALAGAARAALAPALERPWICLAAWPARAAGLAETASRAEWLLDGWGHLAALHAVLSGGPGTPMLAGLIPSWPAEAASWAPGGRVSAPPPRQHRIGRRALGPDPEAMIEAMLAEAA